MNNITTKEEALKEIWKDIEGYEGLYQVSNLGRVKSCKRKIKTKYGVIRAYKERILKTNFDAESYGRVCLHKLNCGKLTLVHRLVAEAFILNTTSEENVLHKNGNPKDNRVENLYWGSQKDNAEDRERHRKAKNKLHHNCKFPEFIIKTIKFLYRNGIKKPQLSRWFGIKYTTICSICSDRSWKHI
jgi:hypothetical protein